jgi:hypothetical protein
MKTMIIAILVLCSCSDLWANTLVNSPFVIGDETYWLVLNDTLKKKGEVWDYDTKEPPSLLPNEVIRIARDILSKQQLANRNWKITSINLKQQTGTYILPQDDGSTNITQQAYSYYEIELAEDLNSRERKQRVTSGNTKLAKLSMIIKMDGEAVLPEKGKHLGDLLPPEAWGKYKLRKGIEQSPRGDSLKAAPQE